MRRNACGTWLARGAPPGRARWWSWTGRPTPGQSSRRRADRGDSEAAGGAVGGDRDAVVVADPAEGGGAEAGVAAKVHGPAVVAAEGLGRRAARGLGVDAGGARVVDLAGRVGIAA